jgi:hypothetical protein
MNPEKTFFMFKIYGTTIERCKRIIESKSIDMIDNNFSGKDFLGEIKETETAVEFHIYEKPRGMMNYNVINYFKEK